MSPTPSRRPLVIAQWVVALSLLGGCGNAPSDPSGDGTGATAGYGATGGGFPSGGSESGGFGGENSGGESFGGVAGLPEETGGTAGAAGEAGSAGAAGAPAPGVGGAGSGGAPSGCPASDPPTGPFELRFDLVTFQCNPSGVCTGAEDKCLCKPDFDALAAIPGHFLAVGGDTNKETTWSTGNVQAVYVDDLNTNWKLGGAQRASDVIAKAKKDFPCGVPKWFIVNEISSSMWPEMADYRAYVIAFAQAMKQTHGKTTIIAAPFQTPGKNGASWSELQKHAYIGVEAYLSGKEIKDHAFSLGWCQSEYQASVAAYAAQGVPKSRLVLFEHFANTDDALDNGIPVKWGRQSVSAADWHKAIKIRSQAAHNVGFAGFVSYAWGGNGMHAPESDRLAFMKTYRDQTLP